ncbi:hypothetical protein K2173_009888 [Erythroxylum novogranatense]|uniref:Retrotransposon gag domain-containing protein n=1 Tax=Erythroxylum novogranatense TaxID=1862640 RepID=A0AAV8SZ82_9ROSI|nr:hypothetical protein K2173_009888 [Erythroxylum novogranatense]
MANDLEIAHGKKRVRKLSNIELPTQSIQIGLIPLTLASSGIKAVVPPIPVTMVETRSTDVKRKDESFSSLSQETQERFNEATAKQAHYLSELKKIMVEIQHTLTQQLSQTSANASGETNPPFTHNNSSPTQNPTTKPLLPTPPRSTQLPQPSAGSHHTAHTSYYTNPNLYQPTPQTFPGTQQTTHLSNPTQSMNTHFDKLKKPKKSFPSFNGSDVRDWIYKANQFFDMEPLSDIEKIKYATYHMEKPALYWHQAYTKTVGLHNFTWDEYITAVCKRFAGQHPLAALKNLTQTNDLESYIA